MEGVTAKETVISPGRGLRVDLGELYRFRELLSFLVWRDIKVRYKQSLLGVAWVVLKPLVTTVIFTLVFGRFAKIPSEGFPYPVFVLIGLISWNYFSSALFGSTQSVVSGGSLISKVYFPRLIVPIGAAVSPLLDAMVSLALLFAVMLWFGIVPPPTALLSPLVFILAAAAALGPGLIMSALFVKYRDVGQVAAFLVQVWMYATPVIYPVSFIPDKYRWLLYLNPVSGVVEAFRACVLPGRSLDTGLVASSVAVSAALLIVGIMYFNRVEKTFADNI